ncbi:hypothetical protein [Corallococcus sp. EGB]|uniref:hypothetical protein n=1 Tax=Corallococcus sp. EGB TaxID=1521117 RepID=UPI001CBA8062|nr:hypothetical protein [Corallococcus sp. EGB]
MRNLLWGVAALSLFAVACGPVEEQQLAPAPTALETQEAPLTGLACANNLGCRPSCECLSGFCVPDGFGPPPPQDYCDQPPQRACSTGSDCLSGCLCQGGVCVNDGFGPPANCLLAPPDSYESDNTHTTASSYLGTPQLNHSFHRQNEVDWVLVATPVNQVMTVETYNLRNGPTMRIDIYAYNYATRTLGALLGSTSTTICSQPISSCLIYRATANVVANGVYAVKITDRRNQPAGYDYTPTPKYDLKMY